MFKRIISILCVGSIASVAFVGCSCSCDGSSGNSGSTDATSSKAQPNAIMNSAVDGSYVNENYHYKLTIPAEIKDDVSINGNDSIVTIYDKYVKDLGDSTYKGVLGFIFVDSAAASIPYPDGSYRVIQTDDQYNYILKYPSEDQYDPEDEESKNSYENTVQYIDEIADSFTLT